MSDVPKKNALKLMVWPREAVPSEVRDYIFTVSNAAHSESNTSILNVLANFESKQRLTQSDKAVPDYEQSNEASLFVENGRVRHSYNSNLDNK